VDAESTTSAYHSADTPFTAETSTSGVELPPTLPINASEEEYQKYMDDFFEREEKKLKRPPKMVVSIQERIDRLKTIIDSDDGTRANLPMIIKAYESGKIDGTKHTYWHNGQQVKYGDPNFRFARDPLTEHTRSLPRPWHEQSLDSTLLHAAAFTSVNLNRPGRKINRP